MAAHRYWRFTILTLSSGSSPLLGELELRTVAGGPNLPVTAGGTPSASNVSYSYASSAFNNDQNSAWGYAYVGAWLQWDFGGGNSQDINHVTLKNINAGSIARITLGVLSYSDDGSTWTEWMNANGSALVSGVTATEYVARGHHTADLTTPPPSLTGWTGGLTDIAQSSPTVAAFSGGTASLTTGWASAKGQGHDATGEREFKYSAPLPTLTAFAGSDSRLTPSKPTLVSTGTAYGAGSAALICAVPKVVGAGTTTAVGKAALTVFDTTKVIGYSGAVCSVQLTGLPTITATGTLGGIGAAAITLPLFELHATGSAQNYGRAALMMPAPRLGTTARAWLVPPGMTMSAIGSATIVVAYEAYALNLGHAPRGQGQDVNDELTRFTNYPFDKIIRYKNSYFGANSTGLYLLEGTTDDAAPISYSVKTKLTDFGTDQMKTPEAAVFGGRLGPDATVTVYTGETEDDVYAYTTPRGQGAQNYRQKFGKGLKARYYAFGVQGTDTLSLDSISFDIAKLKRRI